MSSDSAEPPKKMYIGMIDPHDCNIEPVLNEKKLKSLQQCFLDDKCREEVWWRIPMLWRSECILPSKEGEERRRHNLSDYERFKGYYKTDDLDWLFCPELKDVQGRNYIYVRKLLGGRFLVSDGNHRLQVAKDNKIRTVLAVIEETDMR